MECRILPQIKKTGSFPLCMCVLWPSTLSLPRVALIHGCRKEKKKIADMESEYLPGVPGTRCDLHHHLLNLYRLSNTRGIVEAFCISDQEKYCLTFLSGFLQIKMRIMHSAPRTLRQSLRTRYRKEENAKGRQCSMFASFVNFIKL